MNGRGVGEGPYYAEKTDKLRFEIIKQNNCENNIKTIKLIKVTENKETQILFEFVNTLSDDFIIGFYGFYWIGSATINQC